MRKLLLTTAAAFALGCTGAAVSAQDVVLTPEQSAAYQAWSADQRASYDTWPVDYRTYFWTLTPPQQSGWWRLSDEQRARIYAMAEADRAAAWARIEAQLANPPAPAVVQTQANPTGPGVPSDTPPNPLTASEPVPPAKPADATYKGGPYKGALTPPPPEALNKDYPVCTRTRQDSCRNPGGR